MRSWLIGGVKFGFYYEASSVLKNVPGCEEVQTLPGKMIRRFDPNIQLDGVDVGGFISFRCVLLATTNIKKIHFRETLNDMYLLNIKDVPSLVYIETDTVRVCVCVRVYVLHIVHCRQTVRTIGVFA